MLTQADQELIDRDGRLPGLATLLDPEAFLEAIHRAFPGREFSAPQGYYLRYKPGTSCLIGYDVSTSSGRQQVQGKVYGPRTGAKWNKVAERYDHPRPRNNAAVDREHRRWFGVFPADLEIPAVADDSEGAAHRSRLANELGGFPSDPRWLRYKPERRAVCRYQVDGRQVVVRYYAPDAYRSAASRWKVGLPEAMLRIPKRLANCGSLSALATEWLPGEPWVGDGRVPIARLHGEVPALIDLLKRLHRPAELNLPILAPEDRAREVIALERDYRYLGSRASARAKSLRELLVPAILASRHTYTLTHGDLHAGQILRTEDGLALVDWDELAIGDPADDLASLVAHLLLDRAQTASRDAVWEFAVALYESYVWDVRGMDWRHWTTRLAAAIYRVGMRPFRARWDDWDDRGIELLDFAAEVFHRGASPSGRSGFASPSRGEEVIVEGILDETKAWSLNPLDPVAIAPQVAALLTHAGNWDAGSALLRRITVVRHKPNRRAVVAYAWVAGAGTPEETWRTVLGKIRFAGLKRNSAATQAWLSEQGFAVRSSTATKEVGATMDRVAYVPEVLGSIPAAQAWFQSEVPGTTLTTHLRPGVDSAIATRVAIALWEFHKAGAPASKAHTAADEFQLLASRISEAAALRPELRARLDRVLAACGELAAATDSGQRTAIHRDFYPAQVIVDGSRVYLLDFDCTAHGDPALDVGNFIAHVSEHGLRHFGDARVFHEFEQVFQREYVNRSGVPDHSIEAYRTLSLARHLYLGLALPRREKTVEPLLTICEQRLADWVRNFDSRMQVNFMP